jgi:hypothetical protein
MRTNFPRQSMVSKMKTKWLFLATLCLLSGCAHEYVMTLSNGVKLTTASKPVLKQGRYIYKDANGKQQFQPEGRVRQIEPASMAKEEEKQNQFKPSSGGEQKKKHWYWPF